MDFLFILTFHNLAVKVSAADSYVELILQFTYPNKKVTRLVGHTVCLVPSCGVHSVTQVMQKYF